LVKRQNGDAISAAEIADVKKALENASAVFGDLKTISQEYGLKISHAGKMNMHARRASGIFHDHYRAIGVSFGDAESAPFVMAHEAAHFLDAYAGKQRRRFFASDDFNSPESLTARTFRTYMQTDGRTAKSAYYNRTCECFARAMEQYAARRLSPERYQAYCSLKGYCSDEEFSTQVPQIEQLIETRKELWHPGTARETKPSEKAQEKEKYLFGNYSIHFRLVVASLAAMSGYVVTAHTLRYFPEVIHYFTFFHFFLL
jgi:hypothetical protein